MRGHVGHFEAVSKDIAATSAAEAAATPQGSDWGESLPGQRNGSPRSLGGYACALLSSLLVSSRTVRSYNLCATNSQLTKPVTHTHAARGIFAPVPASDLIGQNPQPRSARLPSNHTPTHRMRNTYEPQPKTTPVVHSSQQRSPQQSDPLPKLPQAASPPMRASQACHITTSSPRRPAELHPSTALTEAVALPFGPPAALRPTLLMAWTLK